MYMGRHGIWRVERAEPTWVDLRRPRWLSSRPARARIRALAGIELYSHGFLGLVAALGLAGAAGATLYWTVERSFQKLRDRLDLSAQREELTASGQAE